MERLSTKNESTENLPTFDTLIVLGHKPEKTKQGTLRLTVDAKLRLAAAAALFKAGKVNRLVLCGGKTHGEKHASEASLMAQYLERKFDVPREAIILEEESLDTLENLEKAQALAPGSCAVLTSKFHASRVKNLLVEDGRGEEVVDAETILAIISPKYKSFVSSRKKKPETLLKYAIETVLRMMPSKVISHVAKRLRT